MIAVEQTEQQKEYGDYVFIAYPCCDMACVKGGYVLQYGIETV